MNTYDKTAALYDHGQLNDSKYYSARQDYLEENMELDRKYGSASHERRTVIIYAAVTVLCFGFAKVYNLLSHGVYSDYMTYLFAAPLLLGWLPSLIMWLFPAVRRGKAICRNSWHSGVAAVTASSLLRGIFEIAGTASPFQSYLMGAGLAMLLIGVVAYILRR